MKITKKTAREYLVYFWPFGLAKIDKCRRQHDTDALPDRAASLAGIYHVYIPFLVIH